jgi:signal transduction histidine kinase/CheY-like chemotaxis protein
VESPTVNDVAPEGALSKAPPSTTGVLGWTRLKALALRARQVLPQGQTLPDAAWERRHRAMLWLLWAHAIALPLYGYYVGYGIVHTSEHAAALAAAGGLAMFGSRRFRSAAVSVGLLTASALLVHTSGGVIEAHFHFFVMIVVLTLYEDWLPFLLAVAYVVLHHGVVGALDSGAVYNHAGAVADPWKWAAIHGAFVLAAGIACVASWRLNEDVRAELGWAQEAQRANQAKSEFLSRVSHELRTPLNAILGFAQLLEMDELRPGQRDNLGHIVKGGNHLLVLLNEVLEISRIESGELGISLEPVNLRSVTDEAIDLVKPLADARNVSIQVAPTVERYVAADYQRLKQILLNLLSNAIKYNRDGGSVWISATEADDDRLRIAVRDTGRGIPQEQLPKLFRPFERLGAENTTVEGTGLGLALCHGLIQAMGGSLRLESEVGVGTECYVELAAAEEAVARQAPRPPKETLPGDRDATTRYSVLCIEDNPSNLKLIEEIFSLRPEIQLLTAVQGTLGLELARQHLPDLLLLDLNLPDLPGEHVLDELRRDPRTAGMSIVVLSADATEAQVKRLLARGADAYLTKPLDVARLLGVLEQTLDGNRQAA